MIGYIAAGVAYTAAVFVLGSKYGSYVTQKALNEAYVIRAVGIKEFDAACAAVKKVRDEAKAKAEAVIAEVKSKI